jgi:hypothetical protein
VEAGLLRVFFAGLPAVSRPRPASVLEPPRVLRQRGCERALFVLRSLGRGGEQIVVAGAVPASRPARREGIVNNNHANNVRCPWGWRGDQEVVR